MTDTTALYRHFNSSGDLLYVGISLSWPARTKAHAQGARWFDQVARIEIENFSTREGALEAERQAIKSEKPQYNVIHNRVGSSRAAAKVGAADPLLAIIPGPTAFVGPALVYRDEKLSVIVAHGEPSNPSLLTEIVLGTFCDPAMPSWAHLAASVVVIKPGDAISLEEGRERRDEIAAKFKKHGLNVQTFDSDVALAAANAAVFPSPKARKILEDVSREKGTMV